MDRLTWAVVVGVLVLVVSGLVVATVARGRTAPPDVNAPAGVVLAYAQAEQRGDPESAWELLSRSAQSRGDRDRFLARAGTLGPERTYFSTEDERIDGDSASVVLVRTYPGSNGLFANYGSSTRTTVRLARENGVWRISVPPDDFLLTAPAKP